MTRYPNWAVRLDAFLRENARRPFRYGDWDCCLFVASAIEAITGVDVAVEFRGRYASRDEARQIAGSVEAAAVRVAAQFDLRAIGACFAQRGDISLVRRGGDASLGLIGLDGDLVVAGGRGLVKIGRGLAKRAWRV